MDWDSLRCNGSHPYGCCTLALCCKLLSLIIKLQADDVIQFMTHNLEPQHDQYVHCIDTYIYNWTINNFHPNRSLEVTDKCSRMGQEKMYRKRCRITEFNLFILITHLILIHPNFLEHSIQRYMNMYPHFRGFNPKSPHG